MNVDWILCEFSCMASSRDVATAGYGTESCRLDDGEVSGKSTHIALLSCVLCWCCSVSSNVCVELCMSLSKLVVACMGSSKSM